MKEEKETEKQNKKKLFTFWSYPAGEEEEKKNLPQNGRVGAKN